MKQLIKKTITTAFSALAFIAVGSVAAQAAESQAKSWNLAGEEKARFEGTVVDVMCELTGDCVESCGGGGRYLGILRADGELVLANKNGQPNFAGPVADLLPFCGKTVEVDGLFAPAGAGRLYQVQFIRETGQADFAKANKYTKSFNARFPEAAKKKGPWFRKHPTINALIERDGYLGLGHAADKEFLEWFE